MSFRANVPKSNTRIHRSNPETKGVIAGLVIVALFASGLAVATRIHRNNNDVPVTDIASIDADRVVAVVSISYEFEYQTPEDRGDLAFILDDGSYRLLSNAGLDSKTDQSLLWNDHGLFAVDAENDLLITKQDDNTFAMETTPHHKDGFLDAMIPTEQGKSRLAVFDVGFDNLADGTPSWQYEYQISYGTGTSFADANVTIDESETSHAALYAACGNDAFTATNDNQRKEGISTLRHLTNGDTVVNRVVSQTRNPLGQTLFAEDVGICRSNTIYSLAIQLLPEDIAPISAEGKSAYPSLETWNVSTGTRQSIPLHSPESETLDNFEERLSYASYLGSPIQGNRLLWISGKGELMATDISSGSTEMLNDDYLLNRPSNSSDVYASIDKNRVSSLMCPLGNDDECTLTFYRTGDGSTEKHLVLRGLSKNFNLHYSTQGFAVNPDYDWSKWE